MDPITLIALAGLGFAAFQAHKAAQAEAAVVVAEPAAPAEPDLAAALGGGVIVAIATDIIIGALTSPPLPDVSDTTIGEIVAGISSGIADDLIVGGSLIAQIALSRRGLLTIGLQTSSRLGISQDWMFTNPAESAFFAAVEARRATLAAAAARLTQGGKVA